MICLRQLYYYYTRHNGQKVTALEDINLIIPKGSYTVCIGPNNSGKSTLSRILSGITCPSSGMISIENREISQWDQPSLRKKIGLIFSKPEDQIIFPTVEEDLSFGLENFHSPPKEIEKKISEILTSISMKEYGHFPTHQLSEGQKQKIAIASMAILGLPYMILDEPNCFLDTKAKKEILRLIKSIHRQGTTIIYFAQDFEELLPANQIISLKDGRIQWQGTLTELLYCPYQIREWGIELPPVIELAESMRKKGYSISQSVYTKEQLISALKEIKEIKDKK